MKRTLADYLWQAAQHGIIDHSLRATVDADNNVSFYIHPDSKDGDTADFLVRGNTLRLPGKTVAEILQDADLKCPWCERPLTHTKDHDMKAQWFKCTTMCCGFESDVAPFTPSPP